MPTLSKEVRLWDYYRDDERASLFPELANQVITRTSLRGAPRKTYHRTIDITANERGYDLDVCLTPAYPEQRISRLRSQDLENFAREQGFVRYVQFPSILREYEAVLLYLWRLPQRQIRAAQYRSPFPPWRNVESEDGLDFRYRARRSLPLMPRIVELHTLPLLLVIDGEDRESDDVATLEISYDQVSQNPCS